MYRVPLPIPELNLESIPNDIGFTMSEIIVLRNAWALIAPDLDEHCRRQFVEFFLNHETLLNRYRTDGPEINMEILHKHSSNLFHLLEEIIYEGVEGPVQMHSLISPISIRHAKRSIPRCEIQAKALATGQYLKAVLWRYMCPTLEQSIDKVLDAIIRAHH